MNILKPNKIKFGEIFTQIGDYLSQVYAQRGDLYSPASPFGQILTVVQSFFQMIFLYLEDSLVEMNITTATKTKSIYGFSRITGHNPTRALSAQGTILAKWKPNVVDLNVSYVTVLDKARLVCENNNLSYFIQIGSSTGNMRINKSDYQFIPMKVIQGEIESQTKIGTGKALQSYNFQSSKPIDNDNVYVTVNGEPYEIVDSLYDMTKDDKLCIVKTGLSGGIDLYFGNEDYGTIPPNGSNITVEYIKTDGFAGNIFGKSTTINFKWLDPVYANTGEEVDLNEYMNITIDKPVILGADAEDPDLTKLIAPKMSRSFVLANPDNYVNFFSRFNYSFVDAYTTFDDEYIDDDNVVYLFLIPDIERRLSTNTDYFTTNLENFYLDSDEKDALYRYVNQSGQQMISSELEIVDPLLTRYVMNIFVRIYDSANPSNINNEITNKITEYLLRVRRRDKVPKSDLIAILEDISGIDSVNISFLSEKNEKAIIDGYYYRRDTNFDTIRGIQTVTETKIMVPENTDPNLGLDDFGDVKIGLNELPVFRGGWYDRFGNYYEDGLSFTQYSSMNIIIKEVIKDTIATQQMNQSKKSIK
jgi:hypothetical protein